MKKCLRFFASLLLLLPFSCNSYDESSSSKTSLAEKVEEYKKEIAPTNQDPINDRWESNLYRNSLYNFRIEFPKNWEYDKGASNITLARAINRDIGATIAVAVKHLGTGSEKNNIQETISKDDLVKQLSELAVLQNVSPQKIKIKDAFLNNFPAYLIEFEEIQKSGTSELTYKTVQIQSVVKSKIYQITLNIPVDFYDDEIIKLFQKTIELFVFEIL